MRCSAGNRKRCCLPIGTALLPKSARDCYSQHHQYWWDNTDGLIGSYQGAMGIKTGYTDKALHCLLFEAARNGRTLIGVVLGSPAIGVNAGAQDAEKMLNWGFGLPPASASASPS